MHRKYFVFFILSAVGGLVIILHLYKGQLSEATHAIRTSTSIRQKINNAREDAVNEAGISIGELVKGPLAQDDPRIKRFILGVGYLHPPTSWLTPYNLTTSLMLDPSMGQSRVIKKIFNYKRNGFFIECGALDGETRSNTLSLERDYGWKGLLIEGDPSNFELMQTKKRKAWTASCCLSIHSYPHEVMYQQDFNTGKISVSAETETKPAHDADTGNNTTFVSVQCFPLFSLLSALNVTTVDYFSLDVEGNELDVLKTIPFHLLQIKVLSVEFIHGKGGADSLEFFMKTKGYKVLTRVVERHWYANDLIFVHESLQVNSKFPPKISVVN